MNTRQRRPTGSPSLKPQTTSIAPPPEHQGAASLNPVLVYKQRTKRGTSNKVKKESSWIAEVKYRKHFPRRPIDNNKGFLALFIHESHWPICNGQRIPVAMLYNNVPDHIYFLIKSGPSLGKMYSQVLRNKEVQDRYGIQYQRVEGKERVNELRKLMGSDNDK